MSKYPSFSLEDIDVVREGSQEKNWKTTSVLSKETGLSKEIIQSIRKNRLHVSAPTQYMRLHFRKSVKKVICPNCGQEFETLGYHPSKYCSPKCGHEFVGKQRSKQFFIKRMIRKWKILALKFHKCPVCSKMTIKRKYCSKECCKKYWFSHSVLHFKQKCKQCGKEFRSQTPKNFCSSKCWGLYLANKSKEQGNWNFTSRTLAKAIINLREINREAYLQMRNSLTEEQRIKFDRVISKFHTKFNGTSYRKE